MKNKFLIFLFLVCSSIGVFGENIGNIKEEFFITEYTEESSTENLKIEQELMIQTVDPVKLADSYSRRVTGLIYDTLFVINSNGEIIPNLVEKYNWQEENKLFIKLKSGVKFHDGSELTSKDVENSLMRLKKEGTVSEMYNSILGIEIVDKYSFIINLNIRDGLLLNALSNSFSNIVKVDNGKFYGTGPYSIEVFNEGVLKLKNFNKCFNGNKDMYKEIEIRWDLNPNQRIIKYTNDINNFVFDLYKEDIEKAEDYDLLSDETVVKKSPIYDTLGLMFGKKYTIDERVAIERAIYQNVDGFFPEGLVEAELSKIDKNYNLNEAKKLISKVGLKSKKIDIMVLNTEHNMKIANYVKKNLEDAGMKVTLLPHGMTSFYQKLYARDYDTAIYNINISTVYPILSLEKILIYDIGDKETANALLPFIELMRKEKNPEKVKKLFDKVLSLVNKNMLYIPIEHKETFQIAEEENMKRFHEIVGY